MTSGKARTCGAGLFLVAAVGMTGAVKADDSPPNQTGVSLVIMRDGTEMTAFSLSMGSGTYVATDSLVIDGVGVATGIIASVDPVGHTEREDGFDFTSEVGTTLEP